MAAEPKSRVTPSALPQIGQRAKPTTPMVTDREIVSAFTEVMLRDPCWRCDGLGRLAGEQTQCMVCGAIWSRENVEEHGQQWIKHTLLPCKHTTAHRRPDYVPTPCPTCAASPVGKGYLPRWMRLGELLPWMRVWFERWYADFSAEITAVQMSQVSRRNRSSSF